MAAESFGNDIIRVIDLMTTSRRMIKVLFLPITVLAVVRPVSQYERIVQEKSEIRSFRHIPNIVHSVIGRNLVFEYVDALHEAETNSGMEILPASWLSQSQVNVSSMNEVTLCLNYRQFGTCDHFVPDRDHLTYCGSGRGPWTTGHGGGVRRR